MNDTPKTDSSALVLAKACAQAMWDNDSASQALGMSLDSVEPGSATLSMSVTDTMTNGFDICHGGYVFLLADSTFAFSCNTYNRVTVAQGCSIEFLRPIHTGDVLTATGREIKRGRTTGLYDIDVVNQRGELAATFRGRSYTLDKEILAKTSS
ncbi:MAG: hydroxyphenylacetyl-CoA thioesterase PaaI [Gammaproteobacteria bacterium]|nr:hydroxyphenylacetyl-CoA thioesterase PaaI [Gammaproteobacteria bacterium]